MIEEVEINGIPCGSILRCHENGSFYWLTPKGEELPFEYKDEMLARLANKRIEERQEKDLISWNEAMRLAGWNNKIKGIFRWMKDILSK